MHILTAASLAGAINFIVTIHNLRTRGMSWTRMPLFVWSIYVFSWLLVATLPTLSAGLTMLLLDRGISIGGWEAQTNFFNAAEGGSAVLYQHAFWFFGHPEVYVLALPAFGIISEVIPVFARKPIFGYKAVAFSTVAIGFFSLLVWAHHMFTVGLPNSLNGFFMVTSMVIAVPTGVKIFNWLATLWRGNLIFETPMLFALGFLSVFTIGGLSGIYLAAFPIDWQVHDTYFVVAHFHYVILGGSVFAIFAGLYYWWPKMFGKVLDERLGKWHFWLLFIGFNITFFPQHMLGLEGCRGASTRTRTASGRDTTSPRPSAPGSWRSASFFAERREDVAEGEARRQRPLAGGHARVVHDLASAAAQFRRGALRDECAPSTIYGGSCVSPVDTDGLLTPRPGCSSGC